MSGVRVSADRSDMSPRPKQSGPSNIGVGIFTNSLREVYYSNPTPNPNIHIYTYIYIYTTECHVALGLARYFGLGLKPCRSSRTGHHCVWTYPFKP